MLPSECGFGWMESRSCILIKRRPLPVPSFNLGRRLILTLSQPTSDVPHRHDCILYSAVEGASVLLHFYYHSLRYVAILLFCFAAMMSSLFDKWLVLIHLSQHIHTGEKNPGSYSLCKMLRCHLRSQRTRLRQNSKSALRSKTEAVDCIYY